MNTSSSTFCAVPPGFRFHPTDEELVDYYLRKKVNSRRIDLDVIKDVDLYKIEPWDLQELCRIIGSEEQSEWYFFSHKDKKYPTGTRTNRATTAGFWKATGRDKAIYTKNELIGMRKTLVFYKGRAPNGQKSDWIMHEYRLETDENAAPQEEGWVVCRVFKKKITTMRKISDHDSSLCWYDDQLSSFMQDNLDSPNSLSHQPPPPAPPYHHGGGFPYTTTTTTKKEHLPTTDLLFPSLPHDPNQYFLQLPLLQTPPPATSSPPPSSYVVDSVTDWRVLDKFVASQLSHDDQVGGGGRNVDNAAAPSASSPTTTTGSSQIDLWK
ncbi:unnamed protein product [Linum tenue]|uniref:NAC domain-containing protein n=1 Tax=Linum tenue TaxID=586396 RepID=A0AAV0J6C5_9ROSI|nr:unnamed protein product [Linum tenue]